MTYSGTSHCLTSILSTAVTSGATLNTYSSMSFSMTRDSVTYTLNDAGLTVTNTIVKNRVASNYCGGSTYTINTGSITP